MQTALEPKTILAVDDDYSVLTVVKSMLESTIYNVAVARTADVAISIAERKDVIDLLLMDVAMPDVRGPDLAERILRIHPRARLLFMSGYAESEVTQHHLPVVDFLRKPFTARTLLTKIEVAFSLHGGPLSPPESPLNEGTYCGRCE